MTSFAPYSVAPDDYEAGAALLSASYQSSPAEARSSGAAADTSSADWHASTTSSGKPLSRLCAFAYAFPPFSSLAVLLLERDNPIARFHAYQAAAISGAALSLIFFFSVVLGLRRVGIVLLLAWLGYSWVAASTAAKAAGTLARVPYLPFVGPRAERWVERE